MPKTAVLVTPGLIPIEIPMPQIYEGAIIIMHEGDWYYRMPWVDGPADMPRYRKLSGTQVWESSKRGAGNGPE